MFELYRKKSFTKGWKKLGEYPSFSEAYKTLNAVMLGFPTEIKQAYRITNQYK